MPIHPLCGQSLPVVQAYRDRSGHCFVHVKHPDGSVLRLPVEWTDRVGPWTAVQVEEKFPKVDAGVLLRLVRALEALREGHEAESGMIHVEAGPDATPRGEPIRSSKTGRSDGHALPGRRGRPGRSDEAPNSRGDPGGNAPGSAGSNDARNAR